LQQQQQQQQQHGKTVPRHWPAWRFCPNGRAACVHI